MTVKLATLARITPYYRVPRKAAPAIKDVSSRIRRFGFQQPIVVDKKGCVIVGHLRYFAAQQLGLEEVPIHVALGLSPKKAELYREEDLRQMGMAAGHWDSLTDEVIAMCESGLALSEMESGQHGADWETPRRVRLVHNRQSESKTSELRFGNHSIPLQRNELASLIRALAEHEQRTGSQRGFVEWLVCRDSMSESASV